MKTGMNLKNRQGGAVAVLVGFSIVLLVGFLALAIDLGHLYIAKSELQNAADAAALSGAKQLDGTLSGVSDTSTNNGAVQWAIAAAAKNNYDFSSMHVDITIADIWVGDCPEDGCMIPASSVTATQAAEALFIKVRTRVRDLTAWFAPIWNIFNVRTYGVAVAGRYITPIAPLGVCAIDPTVEVQYVSSTGSEPKYKSEYGFRRGVSYDIVQMNDFLNWPAPGTKVYIHPTAKNKDACKHDEATGNVGLPFLCTGKSALSGNVGSFVYADTGAKTGQSMAALNTRFGKYDPPLPNELRDAVVCAPDKNVREFDSSTASNASGWMSVAPKDQNVIPTLAEYISNYDNSPSFSSIKAKKESKGGCEDDCSDNYGVLWSFSRPIDERTTTKVYPATTEWPTLFPNGPNPPNTQVTYKGTPPSPWISPYADGLAKKTGPFYLEPPSPYTSMGKDRRRVLNAIIVRCPGPDSGSCAELTVLGVGRFFLQRQTTANIFAEFDGLLPQPLPPAEIRLYR